MWFLRPMAFIGLIVLPMIMALYLFKKKRKDVRVSSTFLWLMAQQNSSADRSIQKIRKNLLMFLQLLAALLCVFTMTSPYIKAENDVNSYRLVIDNSLSMSASEEGNTRLEMAKADAVRLVKGSAGGSVFSVSTLNSTQNPIVSSTQDKDFVIKQIEAIEQSYLPVNYDLLPTPEAEENLIVFSDTGFESEYASSYTYGTPFDNCGIISLNASFDGQNTRVLGKVKNFGSNTIQKQINIYVDDKLYDSDNIIIAPDETKDIVFTRIEGGVTRVKAQLQPEDRFVCDDTRYAVITAGAQKKILLTGENAFLERAFGVMPDVQMYKNQSDNIEGLSGYDLYVFNGAVPQTLPADGQIMLLNPEDNSLFKVDGEVEVSGVSTKNSSGIQLTHQIAFNVYKSKKITLPDWADEIVTSEETPLIFAGSTDRQKLAVIGFDLSNSDLPLKMDFPILIYDILNEFFPSGAVEGGSTSVGVQTELNISPLAEKVKVMEPDGSTFDIAPPFPVQPFKADKTGIYYLEQVINSVSVYEPFAVNMESSDEQYFNYTTNGSINEDITARTRYNYDLGWLFSVLAIIVLAAEFGIFIYRHKSNFSKTCAALRLMTVILLAVSILNPKISLPSKGVTTVFAIDASDSMTDNIAAELNFVNEALKNKPEEDYTAAVIFGKNGEILSSASVNAGEYNISGISDSSATDIQKGAETAASLFKSGTGKRLVLLTDGSENAGDVLSTVRALKNEGVQVKVAGFDNNPGAEVQLSQLKVPEYLMSSECRAEILVESTAQEDIQLQLYAGGKKVYDEQVEVNIGENRFAVSCTVEGSGNIEFKAVAEPAADKYYQNNTAYAHSYIKSAASVLLLEYNDSGSNMEPLLKSGGINVDRLDIGAAPKTVDSLNRYEAVIMADCPYYEMDDVFLSALQSYVKNSAGGLFVTGGANSFAPGGYKDTVLEDILPVNMDLTDNDRKKNTAIVMVVDRSGSMSASNYGVSKLELVKEAMVRSVQVLDSGDSVGVLAFDDSFSWIIEPTTVSNSKDSLENHIYSINDGGGTSIQPAFSEAVDVLAGYEADSKHIILMTDGQGEDSGYEPIISKALNNNISVSTVAVGDDSATELLKEIAENAGGRYYYTDEFTDLPKIFERETMLSNKTYINNEEFYPTVNGDYDILSGIESMPMLGGYIASDKKAAADIILTHDNMEPILAKWQYGLGHTGVFTADTKRQCGSFLATAEGQTILKNAVSSVMRNRSFDDVETEVVQRSGKSIITVQTKNESVISISSTLEGEDYKEEPVFEQVKAGVFEAAADLSQAGNYVLNLNMTTENGSVYAGSVISVAFSDEYDISNLKSGEDTLNKLYSMADKADNTQQIFTEYTDKVFDRLEISLYLIILSVALLFVELVLRRFKPVIKVRKPSAQRDRERPVQQTEPEKKLKWKMDKANKDNEQDKVSTSSILLKNKHNREK